MIVKEYYLNSNLFEGSNSITELFGDSLASGICNILDDTVLHNFGINEIFYEDEIENKKIVETTLQRNMTYLKAIKSSLDRDIDIFDTTNITTNTTNDSTDTVTNDLTDVTVGEDTNTRTDNLTSVNSNTGTVTDVNHSETSPSDSDDITYVSAFDSSELVASEKVSNVTVLNEIIDSTNTNTVDTSNTKNDTGTQTNKNNNEVTTEKTGTVTTVNDTLNIVNKTGYDNVDVAKLLVDIYKSKSINLLDLIISYVKEELISLIYVC